MVRPDHLLTAVVEESGKDVHGGADSGVAACGAGRTVAPSSRAGHAGGEPYRRAYLSREFFYTKSWRERTIAP